LGQHPENLRMDWSRRVVVEIDAHRRGNPGRTSMRRMALVVVATLGLVVPNIVADETTPPQPATPAAAASPAPTQPKAPALDPGQQKLTRRESKERVKNLSDQWREFLQDVEPIMLPQELDTFLTLETDPQREIYTVE